MIPVVSVLWKQFLAVTLWIHLCLQISGWWFALQTHFSDESNKVIGFQFPQLFLIRMRVMTSTSHHWKWKPIFFWSYEDPTSCHSLREELRVMIIILKNWTIRDNVGKVSHRAVPSFHACGWRIISITFSNMVMLWRYHLLIRCLRAEEDRSLHGWALFKDVTIIIVFYNCSSKGCCELIDSRAISPSHPHLYFYCVELKNFKFISTLQRNSWIPANILFPQLKYQVTALLQDPGFQWTQWYTMKKTVKKQRMVQECWFPTNSFTLLPLMKKEEKG